MMNGCERFGCRRPQRIGLMSYRAVAGLGRRPCLPGAFQRLMRRTGLYADQLRHKRKKELSGFKKRIIRPVEAGSMARRAPCAAGFTNVFVRDENATFRL